jgi:hypothetical protein
MLFADKLSFDHPRKTSDGYLVVRARAARAGIYDYLGREIDPEGTTFAADQVVKVYRSEAEVFAQDSVASFLMKPVTNDHPSTPVTADNWRDYAIVDKGRAGPMCRIGDAVSCASLPAEELIQILTDGRTYSDGSDSHKTVPAKDGDTTMPHTLIIDGLQVPNVSDEAKAAIEKLQGQVRTADEARGKAEGDVAKLTTDKSTLEAKVTTLEQQVKDAKLSPQQLRDAAKAFAATLETAKKLAPSATITDSMDEGAIKRAVVDVKLGAASKDWSDEQIAVSFDTLAAQATDTNVDPVRNALSGGLANVGDAKAEFDKSREKQVAGLRDAYKAPAPAAAA